MVALGLVTATVGLGGAGCDGDSDGDGGSGAGDTGTGASGAGTPGSGGSGGSGAGNTGGSGGTGGQGGSVATDGYCALGCTTPADCCQPGQANCPSTQYPTNYTCDAGICGPPRCAVKSDCTANGQLPDYDCLTVGGNTQCAEPCTSDTDCTAPATCTGAADDGTMLCKATVAAFVCDDDTDCNGFGVCNAAGNACICDESSQCTSEYANTCVLP
ncbi:Hypothetical protein CAP_8118 [Chondromyces apiculatus DSM 436]|uniref:Uncharacterized protein n=1 Tax=Chondromyces apiculatus DSM 436 TaxID=1192034 RepID=A0A017TFD9_9BACT|nr:Hypothetical protein CAP_8118 [Chondromyces apiculatus DSM 436]